MVGTRQAVLPSGVRVLERGWLSSNNVLLESTERRVLVDSGYSTHAEQTLALVEHALGDAPLDLLLNTHLHSDHCGGNQLLQRRYPAMETAVPAGAFASVQHWDQNQLSFDATGQQCERFKADRALQPGEKLMLGSHSWQVHAAPGHDPLSIILFEPDERVLISADALWENGFGVVFPELEGDQAFTDVARTLDLIEFLAPRIVIPGHGSVFTDVTGALVRARARLAAFVASPKRHASHAAKVLLKFKLLEIQRWPLASVQAWMQQTPYFTLIHALYFNDQPQSTWQQSLIDALLASGDAATDGQHIENSSRTG